MIDTTKFLLFLKTGDSPDFESYFDTLDDALEHSLFVWKRSKDCLAIWSIDMATGQAKTVYGIHALEHKMQEMERYDEAMDWEERCHRSYPDQHRQTVRDVL